MPTKPKTPQKSGDKPGRVGIPGHNGGGILYPCSLPGNTPGTGMPRSAIREIYKGNSEKAAHLIAEMLEAGKLSTSDVIRAAEVSGKFGLGDAAPEQLAEEEVVRLCLDWCHDFMSRAGMEPDLDVMEADFNAYRKDRA